MQTRKRSILISGAGSGLGRGLSLILSEKGYQVLVTDQHLKAAEETVAMIRERGRESKAYRLDVTSDTNVREVVAQIGEQPIDVLINNAGLQYVAQLEDFPQEKWDALINVMLRGSCLLTRAVLPRMKKEGFGRIINIGSIHSLVASPYKSAYTSAKHGILGFSKVIALETADADITINTICPSYIRTPLVEKQIESQARVHQISEDEVIDKIMLQPMPKKAFITVEEIAGVVEFLISDVARNITGQAITIDGGWTIQ